MIRHRVIKSNYQNTTITTKSKNMSPSQAKQSLNSLINSVSKTSTNILYHVHAFCTANKTISQQPTSNFEDYCLQCDTV